MRTTVTLDSDVEALEKEKMRAGGITFKQAVNDALRDSLAPKRRVPVSFPTYDMGEPRIDVTKALQIAGGWRTRRSCGRWAAADPRRGIGTGSVVHDGPTMTCDGEG